MGTGFINTKLHWLAKCSGINLTHLSWADYTDAFLELLCSLLDNRWCRSLFSEPYILYRIVDDHFPISMVACNYMHDDCSWSVRHTKQEEFDYTGRRGTAERAGIFENHGHGVFLTPKWYSSWLDAHRSLQVMPQTHSTSSYTIGLLFVYCMKRREYILIALHSVVKTPKLWSLPFCRSVNWLPPTPMLNLL